MISSKKDTYNYLMIKRCKQCGREQTVDCFNLCNGHKDGYQSICKICQAEYYKKYYEKRKEEIKGKVKKWREAKKD